ncbi:phosphoenolpyruvate--protein phosphotransferase [Thiohalobacter sp. IOR34]|uniref:phosphoenolpyruvate--protein phosphotransferase n=1 Tax=Thiohalobacter sp. IOR34 TaxID=3057176 RepID=UPI0025AEE3BF|nr:phosphoenolpyruvate--protein phosphotransferase [Thiohalobacter sp. IOR34]WJW74866.1 phosphoenolpyruvate--protein phosphotransferase [Thiohalobacter sp. IOR34]
MSVQITGIGVSRGIAIGRAHILQRGELEVLEYAIPDQYLDQEIARFRRALDAARSQLRAIRNRIPAGTRADIVEFIDTHLLMLEDSTLTVAPEHLIAKQRINAEWALKLQRDALVAVFEEMDDAYLRTRKDDIDHVVTRIQRILLHDEDDHEQTADMRLAGSILLADELTPADAVLMQHQGISAFVTEYGGPLSHTAIIARSLRIPALVGMHNVRRYIRDNELIIVDGQRGVLIAGPDQAMLDYYRQRQQEEIRYRSELGRLKGRPARSRDQVAIDLLGNIELPEDVAAIKEVGAAGVGLYRTEFLYMNRDDLPDEEEQLETYARVIRELGGLPLTIRTLDLGADKHLDDTERTCTNPALGLRAVRLCLRDPSLFRPQLRAILRAAALGPVRMMLPMLSSSHELQQVQALLHEVRNELAAQGLAFDPAMPVGGMIEVPAAALTADFFAHHLDFLSIGTNDLVQYTLAIDRIDDEVNYLYDPVHPAVLELIHRVIHAGQRASTPVSMCGEMAGDPLYTPLLLGLGLRQFSMQASSLLEVKDVINRSDTRELQPLAERLLQCYEPEQRQALLHELLRS